MIKNFFNLQNIEYYEEKSLKQYNTYRVDTICKYLVYPKNSEELINILKELKKENIKYYFLGNGSNIILSMKYYDGVIIKLDKMNTINYDGNLVTADAGCSLIKLAMDTIDKSLSGLIFATGIPGQVGASTAMNAGAYNSDMASVVKKVTILDENLQVKELNNSDLLFSYRDSYLKKNPNLIVLSTTFELTPGIKEEMLAKVSERKNKRMASQPLNMPSAGSVFRNPENMYAGELIEKCNLKGYNINGAEVSLKHANFIVNTGGATGEDIIELINKIQKEVKEKYNVELKLEQIVVE